MITRHRANATSPNALSSGIHREADTELLAEARCPPSGSWASKPLAQSLRELNSPRHVSPGGNCLDLSKKPEARTAVALRLLSDLVPHASSFREVRVRESLGVAPFLCTHRLFHPWDKRSSAETPLTLPASFAPGPRGLGT